MLEEELDPLSEKQQQLITILELIRIEQFIPDHRGYEGNLQKKPFGYSQIIYCQDDLLMDKLAQKQRFFRIFI